MRHLARVFSNGPLNWNHFRLCSLEPNCVVIKNPNHDHCRGLVVKSSTSASSLVKTPEVAARDATIHRLRKKEEQEAKYGASFPTAVVLVCAGALLSAAVTAAWLWESGLLSRRKLAKSLLADHQGNILTNEYKCKKNCAGCNQPITGAVIAAGGDLWHPNHHICSQCKTTLQDQMFFLHNGKLYCEKDYKYFVSECSVCKDKFVLTKPHVTNAYGDVYCASHKHNTQCSSCHRIISSQIGDGAISHADGRKICSACNMTSITTSEEAVKLLEEVRADVEKIMGLDLGKESFNVSLVSQKQFGKDGVHAQGMTLKHVQRSVMRARVTGRSIDSILLLDNLNRLTAGYTLAHEIMHCHFFLRAFPEMPRVVEEGLCELVAYLWLVAKAKQDGIDSRDVAYRLSSLENNPNPIYGQGLHLALRSFMASDLPFADFLSAIQKSGKLPMGPVTVNPATNSA